MKLGKRYSLFKKGLKYNLRPLYVLEDGTEYRPHRKLNMMLVLVPLGYIKPKALEKEEAKLLARLSIEKSKRQEP